MGGDVLGLRAANATRCREGLALRCASLLLLPIDGLRATTSAAAGARAAMGRVYGEEGAGISCKRVSGDGVAVADAVAAGGGGLVAV